MKTRIISAAVACVFAVIILILHNTFVFPVVIAILSAFMLYELFHAASCLKLQTLKYISYVFALMFPFFTYQKIADKRNIFIFVTIACMFVSFIFDHKNISYDKFFFMLAVTLLIPFSMNTLVLIMKYDSTHGLFYLILALCGAWLADSGAYFSGTLFGKHKLCPEISPKKTVEGLVGGTIVNAVLFVLIGLFYTWLMGRKDITVDFNYILLAILGMICSLLGLVGDLSASLVKRQCQIKDYGKIMPGHGGILDRFDSVLFVVPFMYLALQHFTLIR